jgi:hypothetical protein
LGKGDNSVIFIGFKKKDENEGGVLPSRVLLVVMRTLISCVTPCSWSSGYCLSAGAAQGTDCSRNSSVCGPHEVAIDTDVQGAGELLLFVCIFPLLWGSWRLCGCYSNGDQGECVGGRVFVCICRSVYRLHMDTSDSVLLRKVVREGGRSEVDRK